MEKNILDWIRIPKISDLFNTSFYVFNSLMYLMNNHELLMRIIQLMLLVTLSMINIYK